MFTVSLEYIKQCKITLALNKIKKRRSEEKFVIKARLLMSFCHQFIELFDYILLYQRYNLTYYQSNNI